jgi:hypothetical protein
VPALQITVEDNGIPDKISGMSDKLLSGILISLKEGMTKVMLEARSTHRFISRTGSTERSVQMRVTGPTDVEDYLELGIASYAPYTHEGHGTWAPDQFLYEAFDRNLESIEDGVQKIIDAAVEGV